LDFAVFKNQNSASAAGSPKEIVEQIEIKQKAIEHARAVIENLERERDAILAKRLENKRY